MFLWLGYSHIIYLTELLLQKTVDDYMCHHECHITFSLNPHFFYSPMYCFFCSCYLVLWRQIRFCLDMCITRFLRNKSKGIIDSYAQTIINYNSTSFIYMHRYWNRIGVIKCDPNKTLSKQPWSWWFETPSWSLWRQCNVLWHPW